MDLEDDKSQEDVDPGEIDSIFSSVEEKASRLQGLFIDGAQQFGYTKEAVHSVKDFFIGLANAQNSHPEFQPILYSGSSVVDSIGKELDNIEKRITPILPGLNNISSSVDLFYNTTNTTAGTISMKEIGLSLPEEPPFNKPEQQHYIEKLNKIDPPLSKTYQEIGQVLYGTNSDPRRAALAMMRQTFDHFFEIMAPDEEVRRSIYWKPKKDPLINQVTRREKMTYAAYTRIVDKSHAKTIITLFDNILDTYRLLNELHKRGTLSEKQSRSALKTMEKFIETWIDAIDI
jgi:hypothetical protein